MESTTIFENNVQRAPEENNVQSAQETTPNPETKANEKPTYFTHNRKSLSK